MRLSSTTPSATVAAVMWTRLGGLAAVFFVWALTSTAGGAMQGGGGGGNGPLDRMVVDPAAADRGRSTWAAECITCHGAAGRGGEGGPNILRSEVVIRNRNGDTLGPFLKKGHSMQSGRSSAELTSAQVVELSHFLRQRFTDTFRGSPLFVPGNVLVGNVAAGAAFFNGEGKCTECHSATGNLAGIGGKYDPVTLQQRLVFPMVAGGRGRGGAVPKTAAITLPGEPTLRGDLIEMDDFLVTIRTADGRPQTIRRGPDMKVELQSRFDRHISLLDTLTDAQMHDLVAYLETLK